MAQPTAISIFPMILLSEASRENSFSSLIKEHSERDDFRPGGDLVLCSLETLKTAKLAPGRRSRDSTLGKGSPLSPRFPVTATLPLLL